MNEVISKRKVSKLKAITIALGIVMAGIAGKTGDYYLRPAIDLVYQKATAYEYDQLKPEMTKRIRAKLDKQEKPSHNEMTLWLAICREEIKRNNGLKLKDVTDKNVVDKLLIWMEKR